MRYHSTPCIDMPEGPKRSEIKSAADPNFFENSYIEPPGDRQTVLGGQSFADLRDEMNDRRRLAARRTRDTRW